jgi:hypothetical protein
MQKNNGLHFKATFLVPELRVSFQLDSYSLRERAKLWNVPIMEHSVVHFSKQCLIDFMCLQWVNPNKARILNIV